MTKKIYMLLHDCNIVYTEDPVAYENEERAEIERAYAEGELDEDEVLLQPDIEHLGHLDVYTYHKGGSMTFKSNGHENTTIDQTDMAHIMNKLNSLIEAYEAEKTAKHAAILNKSLKATAVPLPTAEEMPF